MPIDDSDSLTNSMFEILLALAGEPKHGYAIMREVEEETEGRVQLPPGTLYRTIRNLIDLRYIERTPEGSGGSDARRNTYRLTPLGRKAASLHARRLAVLVSKARDRKLLTPREAL